MFESRSGLSFGLPVFFFLSLLRVHFLVLLLFCYRVVSNIVLRKRQICRRDPPRDFISPGRREEADQNDQVTHYP